MMKFKFTRSALLVLPVLVLAACGGGGGGGGGDNSSSGSSSGASLSANLAITSDNAKSVAADGLDSSTNAVSAQAGAGLVTGVQVDAGAAGATVPSLSAVALKLAGMAAGKVPAMPTGVAVNESGACTYGGTIAITGNVSGGEDLVAGDTLTITATNCMEVIDNNTSVSTLNGSLTLTVNSGTFGSSGVYPQNITMTIVARALSTTTLGVTDTSDGDMKIELQQVSATAANSTLSGASLTNTWTSGSSTRSSSLKDYKVVQGTNGTTVRSDVTATVVTNNSRVGTDRVYTVTTPTPIVRDLAIVASGSIKVVGAKSSLLLTVTSPNNFTLQVDTNGDGTYDSTTTTTMAELQGLL